MIHKTKLVVFDFDGVLTDNRVYVSEEGKETVCCNRGDGLAFDALRLLGFPVFIISRESNPVVNVRAEKLNVPVIQSAMNKRETLLALARERGLSTSEILYVGNDLNDLEAMRVCGASACPADSHARVKEIATHILQTKGGDGVAREVAEAILGIDIVAVLGK